MKDVSPQTWQSLIMISSGPKSKVKGMCKIYFTLHRQPHNYINSCLGQGFTAVRRHYDHRNSYGENHVIVQRFSPLWSCQEAWRHAGRRGESSTSRWAGSRKGEQPWTWTYFLQEGHTYFNKATPTPTRPYLPIVPLLTSTGWVGGIFIQISTVMCIIQKYNYLFSPQTFFP